MSEESEIRRERERVLRKAAEHETQEAPRPRLNAATLEAHRHELEMARATKPGRSDTPAYSLKRSTASGSLGVVAIDVEVPVCELYPTGDEAIAHLIETFDTLAARYPMPDGYVRAK